jgi:hypothetical protein
MARTSADFFDERIAQGSSAILLATPSIVLPWKFTLKKGHYVGLPHLI